MGEQAGMGDRGAVLCSKCHERSRSKGQRWCQFCRNEGKRRRRAERHIELATGADRERTENGERTAGANDGGPRADSQVEPEVVPPGNGNGRNGGNGHWAGWNPRSKVATRVFLAALGRNNGEATPALIDKLAAIPLTEKNPWVLLAFWREFRNAVEGTPPKATPPPD